MKRDDHHGAKSNDLLNKTQEVKESIDVNGFQVLPSQVESVRRIFERHPDIAVEFRGMNRHLRTTFMNSLLSIIETLCQPLEELSNEDLVEADIALIYLKDVGFSVVWLEKKLKQLKVKKEKHQSGLASLKDIEQRLHDLMDLCHKKKSEALSIGAPLKFDDLVQSVSHIFERHPDIAVGFRPKNQQIRRGYMDALPSLVETLCQSPEKLSGDDLSNADDTLVDLIDAGFELDWLKKKLDEVSEKKKIEQGSGALIQTMEEQLQKMKLLFLDLELQLQKEKAKALAARAPLSFKDVIC